MNLQEQGLWGGETTQYNTTVVDTCHYTVPDLKQYRMSPYVNGGRG